jgi:hypothetical protein
LDNKTKNKEISKCVFFPGYKILSHAISQALQTNTFIRQTPPFSDAARENLQLSQSPHFFYLGNSCVGQLKVSSAL